MQDQRRNAIARAQLGLPDDHEIFLESIEIEYLDDGYQQGLEELQAETGSFAMSVDDVIEFIESSRVFVRLPPQQRLVGMRPVDGGKPTYGLVDFTVLNSAHADA